MVLALFDFDGTITYKDSFIDFIIYAVGYQKFFIGLFSLSHILIKYKLSVIPNWQAKEMVLKYFFRGWDISVFEDKASQYSRERLPRIIRKTSLARIDWHKSQGHQVVVVSASIDRWLKGWCEELGLELISTQIEVISGKITGKLLTKNCYGIEKVRRIKEKYDLGDFEKIFAYGDSSGDRAMFAVADIATLIK